MYYPYLRGKQYELVLLRERASLMSRNGISPIIEPISDSLGPLRNTVKKLVKEGVQFILVVNPQHGKLRGRINKIIGLVEDLNMKDYPGLLLGYIVDASSNKDTVAENIGEMSHYKIALIHYGFSDGKGLSRLLNSLSNVKANIFIENHCGKVYQKAFNESRLPKVLIRDGFKIRRNDLYPKTEHFSDLHLTFAEEGYTGFGDFLIVGDQYREHGGPAHAIAIHISYLDEDEDMHVMHFISDRKGSPVDPGGKFQEALVKLQFAVSGEGSLIYQSDACDEYIELCEAEQFRGLGYAKKLSMQHHIELITSFLSN